ncbi:hypothetical protein BOVA604_811 [Bacteroides ovatus]|nr:hypothetical protein BOVA604_811 [Bacteroides ovatus]DAZ72528.1 MAG TPA: hypothetical protein [Caudoviricetes sp.]
MFQMLNGGIFFSNAFNFYRWVDDLKHIDAIRSL